jgi:hypothetical protein
MKMVLLKSDVGRVAVCPTSVYLEERQDGTLRIKTNGSKADDDFWRVSGTFEEALAELNAALKG